MWINHAIRYSSPIAVVASMVSNVVVWGAWGSQGMGGNVGFGAAMAGVLVLAGWMYPFRRGKAGKWVVGLAVSAIGLGLVAFVGSLR